MFKAKKVISLTLVCVMALGAVGVAAASSQNTQVEYVGKGIDGDGQEKYTVTVPGLLEVGGEAGSVTVEGGWGSHRKVTVDAPSEIVLANKAKPSEQLKADIIFNGIAKVGDDFAAIATTDAGATESISVAAQLKNMDGENVTVKYGTWEGTIVYTIDIVNA